MALVIVEQPASLAGYQHTQSVAATVWTVNHNLGRYPTIELFTVGGVQMIARVTNLSVNTLQVNFNSPTAGSARVI